jgi:hypothetical protein
MLKLSLVLPQTIDELSLQFMDGLTSPLALVHIQVMEEDGEDNSYGLVLVLACFLMFGEDLD